MAKFFIRRPIVAIVIAIITVVLGLVAMRKLPIAQFPQIVPPQIMITATYPGADAQTIEQAVAAPVEQQMNGVDNMMYMQSINANDNTMQLVVTFGVDTDPNTDQVNVQNRLSQAAANLPPEVSQYGMTFRKQMGLPLLGIALYSPHKTHDSLFMANYANINLIDPISRIPGVGQVLIFGAGDYSMRIWVRPDLMAKLGLTVPDLARAIQAQSSVNPAGQLGGPPAPPGTGMTYVVRTQGRLMTADQFGQIVVRANPDGSVVRLKDVARLELGALTYKQISRFNGQPGCILAVFQEPGSNALAVANSVKKVVAQMQARFPSDLQYAYGLDTTVPVTEGIHEIALTLLEALALVILVVYLFLQNWRATLIPLVAVPVSLIGTFAFFPLFGFSINTLSLFGLVLAIGLVVDDAIVVVEAVEHHIEQGMTPREATQQAMKEVSGPVVGIALILVSVFVPMALTGGIQGLLNQQFALTIAISVAISAFNALTLSPALSALLLRPRKHSKGPLARFFALFNRGFARTTHGYLRVSHGLIRKSVIALLLLAAFAALDGSMAKRLPTSFLPQEDYGFFFLNVQLPAAASLQRTDAALRDIDRILAKEPGVGSYTTIAGFSLLSRVSASYNGFYFVSLKPYEERNSAQLNAEAIIKHLNGELARSIPQATAFAFSPPPIPGLGNAGGFSFWLQDRSGGSVDFLAQNLQKFLAAARKRPELTGVTSLFSAAVPQVYLDVDRDRALKQGIALSDVYQTLQAYLGGLYVNQFNRFGRQWRVFLQADGQYRVNEQDINQFYVRNNKGDMVPLSALVTTRKVTGPEFTNRFNLYRAAQVIGAAAPGYSSGQALAALEQVEKQTMPPQMGYEWSDLSYQETHLSSSTGAMFAISLMFVFLILAALYESWSLPFSVLLSVPVAVFGAFMGIVLRHYSIDVYTQIGLIMLIGLAAKNAILIIEFARAEYQKGRGLVESALSGAQLRLRPILMTSFALILGCVPLWMASGSGSVSRRILGTVVIAGMLSATLLGIFLIPALFVVVEKLTGRKPAHHAAAATESGEAEA